MKKENEELKKVARLSKEIRHIFADIKLLSKLDPKSYQKLKDRLSSFVEPLNSYELD
jgi:hypothetical protein